MKIKYGALQMNKKTSNLFESGKISKEEWDTRIDLAACYRLMNHFGMDDLIYNHISARVPGPEEHFLLNPFGLLYEEITASNLVKVDLDGKIVLGWTGVWPGLGVIDFIKDWAEFRDERVTTGFNPIPYPYAYYNDDR